MDKQEILSVFTQAENQLNNLSLFLQLAGKDRPDAGVPVKQVEVTDRYGNRISRWIDKYGQWASVGTAQNKTSLFAKESQKLNDQIINSEEAMAMVSEVVPPNVLAEIHATFERENTDPNTEVPPNAKAFQQMVDAIAAIKVSNPQSREIKKQLLQTAAIASAFAYVEALRPEMGYEKKIDSLIADQRYILNQYHKRKKGFKQYKSNQEIDNNIKKTLKVIAGIASLGALSSAGINKLWFKTADTKLKVQSIDKKLTSIEESIKEIQKETSGTLGDNLIKKFGADKASLALEKEALETSLKNAQKISKAIHIGTGVGLAGIVVGTGLMLFMNYLNKQDSIGFILSPENKKLLAQAKRLGIDTSKMTSAGDLRSLRSKIENLLNKKRNEAAQVGIDTKTLKLETKDDINHLQKQIEKARKQNQQIKEARSLDVEIPDKPDFDKLQQQINDASKKKRDEDMENARQALAEVGNYLGSQLGKLINSTTKKIPAEVINDVEDNEDQDTINQLYKLAASSRILINERSTNRIYKIFASKRNYEQELITPAIESAKELLGNENGIECLANLTLRELKIEVDKFILSNTEFFKKIIIKSLLNGKSNEK